MARASFALESAARRMASGGASQTKGHRWFAATYDLLYQRSDRKSLKDVRTRIVGGAKGRVLEIGVGTGASLPFYAGAQRIVATEPDPYMLPRAQARAAQLGLNVEFHTYPAEALAFPDACFDTVVSTLVLGTVKDQARSLQEVRRVLKPGGEFRFIEFVRGEGFFGFIHDLFTPAWRWLGAGCRLNRRTLEALQREGFGVEELQRKRFLMLPLIAGVARPTGSARAGGLE